MAIAVFVCAELVAGTLARELDGPVNLPGLSIGAVENPEGPFGLPAPELVWLTLGAAYGSLAAGRLAVWPADPRVRTGLALFLVGCISNTIDRLAGGSVTDYVGVANHLWFNLSDVAIVAGVWLWDENSREPTARPVPGPAIRARRAHRSALSETVGPGG